MNTNENLTLKIFNIWDPIENKNFWEATIEIPNNYSLFDLHYYIQEITKFDNDHIFDFYAGRSFKNRKVVFTEDSGYPDTGGEYKDILLKDIYPLNKLKLYYLFDYGDEWIFEIHKRRNKKQIIQNCNYPRIVSENGIKLKQYAFNEF